MKIENVRDFTRKTALGFGAKVENEFNKSYIERNNTRPDALNDNGAYFGFISPEEETSGPFHDFSLTIFPSSGDKSWLICLGVGSSGFKNDYDLATYPGVRRLFSKLIDENGFCKSDFSDIETNLPKSFIDREELQHIKNTIKTYSKVLPACQIVEDPESDFGKQVIAAFIAAYAKLRGWGSNKAHREAISDALGVFIRPNETNNEQEIKALLEERKYIILQGPPGTGKTKLAKEISTNVDAKIFFTQFHAETSYSDFIYGIRPDLKNNGINYTHNDGTFLKALKHSIETKEKTVLIIDEINRANLSNVLGPIFYLFEYKRSNSESDIEIELHPDYKIKELPQNFYVIATMNTADRSLAVVDFALRRRFAWYDLKPKAIDSNNFYKQDFSKIKEIFDWYADSNELSLQPGQGYFIASSEEEMKNRVKYEILPLIKEYLREGLLVNAKDEFNDYFVNRVKKSLFE
jgi:Holliday junction resolvasome RuvABC ATP-dependent DNA helicase subunit